jgi:formylglycine-generating enzyme required for sulfatase activity
MLAPEHPKVFISYSHDSREHMDRVLTLSDRLRADGIDCHLDQYEESPPEGWPRWMLNQIQDADVVLVVCTEHYERRFRGREARGRGLGAQWEGAIITQELYEAEAHNTMFIPVLFCPDHSAYIPIVLRGATYYNLHTEDGYAALYRRLTNQPLIQKPALGSIRPMPPLARKHPPQEKPFSVSRTGTPQEDAERVAANQPFEPEMILIPAGEFLMGSDPRKDQYAQDDEQPQGILYLPDFYLAKTPVTNGQYRAFVTATDYHPQEPLRSRGLPGDKEDHPVVGVPWYQAVAYCGWLSKMTGRAYSLPSEAEWEKAARGTDGRIYPWGDEWDPKRCNSRESRLLDTTSVEAYLDGASSYGILDLAGNVSEWTRSIWDQYPYVAQDGRERLERLNSFYRRIVFGPPVRRGGSFYEHGRNVRCAVRLRDSTGLRDWDMGFRVVMHP